MAKSMEKGAQSYPGQVLAAGGTRAVLQAGRKLPAGGTQMSMGGTKVAREWDAGGPLSRPAQFLEASFRLR